MHKYGCVALVAIAGAFAMPAAQAKGNFFAGADFGRAHYDDSGLDEDSANTRALSGGYRWQAGQIAQVGIEAGLGKVDEISQDSTYSDPYWSSSSHLSLDVDYRNIGANARISFGRDSRWFGIARGGYMSYKANVSAHYVAYSNGQLAYDERYSTSDTHGGGYFGLGVGVDLTSHVNLHLMRNAYAYSNGNGTDDVGTATTTTLGLEVRF